MRFTGVFNWLLNAWGLQLDSLYLLPALSTYLGMMPSPELTAFCLSENWLYSHVLYNCKFSFQVEDAKEIALEGNGVEVSNSVSLKDIDQDDVACGLVSDENADSILARENIEGSHGSGNSIDSAANEKNTGELKKKEELASTTKIGNGESQEKTVSLPALESNSTAKEDLKMSGRGARNNQVFLFSVQS